MKLGYIVEKLDRIILGQTKQTYTRTEREDVKPGHKQLQDVRQGQERHKEDEDGEVDGGHDCGEDKGLRHGTCKETQLLV